MNIIWRGNIEHEKLPARHKASFLFQIPCADLHEVIDALVEKTAGTLQPFLLEEPYEENISEEMQHKHIFRILLLTYYAFFFAMRLNSLCVISIRFSQRWERREDPPHRPLQPPAKGPRPASKTRFVSAAQTTCRQSAQQTVIMIPAFVPVQIVGPAAPCPGLPPLTAVSWLHQCRPHPPTRWDDSSSLPPLSHRVSRQLILIYYQIWFKLSGCVPILTLAVFAVSQHKGTISRWKVFLFQKSSLGLSWLLRT